MAIVVEDGTGKTDSNSYASEAELSAYATARGITISGTAAILLIQAMDYIEAQPFKGIKGTQAQALQWPRYGVMIDGYVISTDDIPLLLKEAQMEMALAYDAGYNPLATLDRETESETVGDISVTYTKGSRQYVYVAACENKLRKLLGAGSGGMSAAVIRA